MNFNGVWVATLSFFNSNFSVDLKSFENHCSWLLDSGVDGLVPCGTTGEGPTLNAEERKQLIEISVKLAQRKGKKVIAGCGGNNTESVLKLILDACNQGVDAVLVVTPYYNKPTQEGLLAHYRYLADRSPRPIFLYNVPSRTGVNLLPETVRLLWDHGNIIGLKEATGMHSQWLSLASFLPAEKTLLAGDDDAFATLFSLGARGIISASANIIPAHFVQLYNLLNQGRSKEAQELQLSLLPLIKALFSETNPCPLKYALSVMGRGHNYLRLPLVPVQSKTEQLIKAEMDKLGLHS